MLGFAFVLLHLCAGELVFLAPFESSFPFSSESALFGFQAGYLGIFNLSHVDCNLCDISENFPLPECLVISFPPCQNKQPIAERASRRGVKVLVNALPSGTSFVPVSSGSFRLTG